MSKQAIETIPASAPAEPRPRTLLVAVDDPAIHEVLQDLLANTEWIVDCVEEGENALARLEVCCYDAILTDLITPGMTGPALLSYLRKRHLEAHTLVMKVKKALLFGEWSSLEQLNSDAIKLHSDRTGWISLQVDCRLTTANRVAEFMRGLLCDLNPRERDQITAALRELLLNAVEHGGRFDPQQTVDLSYIRTARSILCYIRDPGDGFSFEKLEHAAVANTSDQGFRHLEPENLGMRSGGFGLLMAKKIADELIYSEKGNEVIFIKYL